MTVHQIDESLGFAFFYASSLPLIPNKITVIAHIDLLFEKTRLMRRMRFHLRDDQTIVVPFRLRDA